jgi:predicted ferric reductase
VAVSAARRRIAGWGLALLAVGNGLVVVGLWGVDGIRDMDDTAGALTGLGRVTGLLGAYLALVQLLLLARLPVLDRLVGLHRLTAWHRAGGFAVLALLVAHTLLITAGYTVGDNISLGAEIDRLITGYPGVITATAGLVALIGVTVTSIVIVRRRLSYETWYFVHLYAYLAIVLAFSHQLATGSDFVGDPLARAYWYALYIVTLGAIVGFRIALPVVRSLRHRLRVASVSEEGPGVVSVEIGGVALERLRARTGQFFTWRFLTRERWFQAHPFSLSAAPDPSRLRITVKGVGDFSTSLRTLRPGTRVIVEGPFGSFTAATASRRSARCWRTCPASRATSPSCTARSAPTT